MDRERRLNLLIVVLTVAAIFAVPYVVVKANVIGVVLGEDRVDCDGYEFDRGEWISGDEDDREAQAEGLDRCDNLVDLPRAEVAAMLDEEKSRHRNRDRWVYFAGETNDFLGPGDGVSLNVFFGKDGAVTGTRLSAPLD